MHRHQIAWNGVRLAVPAAWEPRVAAACHLIFEEAFQPVLQLRWYKRTGDSPKEWQGLAAALAKQGDSTGSPQQWTDSWQQLETRFKVLAFAAGENSPGGGAFSCPHCHTVFHFQIFPGKAAMGEAAAEMLARLSCHDHDDDLWRIQDFSLSLPPGFTLTDHTFAPGLTRLAFAAGQVRLFAARLAPAGERLQRQSLAEILSAQAAVDDLQLAATNPDTCEGRRHPNLVRRLLFCLRGDRPFVRARITRVEDRLLTLILSARRPLPKGLLSEIAEGYGIL